MSQETKIRERQVRGKTKDNGFDSFYRRKLEESESLNVKPGNEEKLLRSPNGDAPAAILYIHGFKACRAEGEFVIDAVADRCRANAYYLRLPGHGSSMEDLAKAECTQWIAESAEALFMMKKLGKKVIVSGTSLGGFLSLYLASRYSEMVDALVLCSPFIEFPWPLLRMMKFQPIFDIVGLMMPVVTDPDPVPDESDNWTGYWYRRYYFSSLSQLYRLQRMTAGDAILRKISVPALMFHYSRDKYCSAPVINNAFELLGSKTGKSPFNRIVRMDEGNHVMFSKYFDSNKNLIIDETEVFLKKVLGARSR